MEGTHTRLFRLAYAGNLRTLFVTRLMEAITPIAPGSRFERFGGNFLKHYLGIPLNNRRHMTLPDAGPTHHHQIGLNVLGYTIDTVSDLGDIAAEYRIEKKFFDGKMEKSWGLAARLRGPPRFQT